MTLKMKFILLPILFVGLVSSSQVERERQGRHLSPKFWSQLTTSLDRLGEQVASSLDSVFGGNDEVQVRASENTRAPVAQQSVLRPRDPPLSLFGPNFNPFDLGGPVANPFLNLFETVRNRNWWEGPNVCIERSEADEFLNRTTSTKETLNVPDVESSRGVLVSDVIDLDASEEVEVGNRQSRQFQSHVRMSSCEETQTAYICTTRVRTNGIRKTFKTKYSCCYGFGRSAGTTGCSPVEIKPLSETLVASNARSFLALMQDSKMIERAAANNYTFFVPQDAGASPAEIVAAAANDVLPENIVKPVKLTNEDDSENEILRKKRDVNSAMSTNLMGHIVPGIYMASDLKDEMVLDSEDASSKVRLNIYHVPERVVTANCKRITKGDQFTSEGVVHMLEGPMQPASKTLAKILESDPKYSSFYEALKKADMLELLGKPGQLTVFAPINDAFDKLSEVDKWRFANGFGCLDSVLRHHMLPNVICSTALTGQRARTRTIGASHILLEKKKSGDFLVEGSRVLSADEMGTNGIIHAIDGVLIPERAKTIKEVLRSRNFTEFINILDIVTDKYMDELELVSDFTLLVPTNSAVRQFLDDEKNKDLIKGEALLEVLRHHILTSALPSSQFKNNQKLQTGAKSVTMNTYSSFPSLFGSSVAPRASVQCAPIVRVDIPTCRAVMHVVDTVFIPPKETVMDVIKANSSLSIFTKLVEGSGLAEQLKNATGTFTVMAPTDQAFYNLPEETLSEMLKEPQKTLPTLKEHVLPEYLCCAGIQRGGLLVPPNRRSTLGAKPLTLTRLMNNQILAGEAIVAKCDGLAENGVVHTIDQVLLPQATRIRPFPVFGGSNRRTGFPDLELVLFG